MKSKVIVRLKEGVLDPQGQTIQRSLKRLGVEGVSSVRQGKFFELEFSGESDPARVRKITEEIARNVLSNPIIETFEVEADQ
ncbi:MAG TPA: phosphoribosylformylglycinamidine synthase subunit PurS [Acidobacteriota bacterium]|nr:phosphoribosylformylglycinamidine synthase subunit PurS [Acidobacteriota bacterium]